MFVFPKKFEALNQNFAPNESSAMGRTTHAEIIEALAQKLKEDIDFNCLTYF